MMQRDDQAEKKESSFVANVKVMRRDLAQLESFLDWTKLSKHAMEDERIDLDFVMLPKGIKQVRAHEWSISVITAALLHQVLKIYCHVTKKNKELKDPDVETALNNFDDRVKCIDGMRRLRNSVFHVRKLDSCDKAAIGEFDRVWKKGNGQEALIALREALYAFTCKWYRGHS